MPMTLTGVGWLSARSTAGTTNAPVQLVDAIQCQSLGIHGESCPVR
jgi:hypothetical protein